jgi:hypothetical protein
MNSHANNLRGNVQGVAAQSQHGSAASEQRAVSGETQTGSIFADAKKPVEHCAINSR